MKPLLADICLFLTFAAAGPLAVGAAPKVDYLFPAGAQAGKSVSVTAGGTFQRWPVKVWTSSEKVRVTADKTKGKLTVAVAADAQPGVCWIRLYDKEGAASPRPFVIGTIAEVPETEPNDDPRHPQTLPSSSVVINGRLQKRGDVDAYAVRLKKGQTLVASMTANGTLGSPMDGVLQIVSPRGFVLEQNDDNRGLDPQIVFTAPRDGDFLVRTFAFPVKANSTIGFAGGNSFVYRLTVTTGPFVDYCFPLAVSPNKPSRLQLYGWNIPPSLKAISITLSSDRDTAVVWHPRLANLLNIPVTSHPTRVEQESENSRSHSLAIPVTLTGRIARPRETDVFRFEAKKGQRLRFRAESRSLGYPLDPFLEIIDSKDKRLAQNDDVGTSRDALLNFTAPADGSYRLLVRDLHLHGGTRYVYRLTAAPIQPDFALTITADSFVIAPGKPLEIAVKVARLDGFSQPIEIKASQLPAGISAKAVTLDAKSKSTTVKLMLNAAKGSSAKDVLSGPFVITGSCLTNGSRRVRSAQAALPDLRAAVKTLWLTAISKK